MKITLISQEEYNNLLNIQQINPLLTYQNTGYDEIDKSKLSDKDIEAIKEVESILKSHVSGFSRFQNFKTNKAGEIGLRFQYNYNYDGQGVPFIGVGYINIKELLNGFED